MNVGGAAVGGFDKSHGWATGFATKIGGYQLFGDYVSSQLAGATAGIPTNPKAWAVELTNSTVCPPVFFSALTLLTRQKWVPALGWFLTAVLMPVQYQTALAALTQWLLRMPPNPIRS
jgi:hypothetical protein